MPPYRDFNASPLQNLLIWLSRSFRVGRFFGVEVRMFWLAAVLMPLLFLSWFRPVAGTPLELLVLVAFSFGSLFVIVWSHEMGHILWGRRYGIQTPLITLSPMGGVAHMAARATGPRSEALVALAGPAVHLLWLAVCWPLHWLLPYGSVSIEGWRTDPVWLGLEILVSTNLAMLVFNLLPLFPMDGGRVLRALLSLRLHPNRATLIATAIGIVGGGLLILAGFTREGWSGSILVFIGLSNIAACLEERRVARHSFIYGVGGEQREAWQSDPEAWRRGEDPFAHVGSDKPQRAAAGKKQQRAAETDADLDRQVDEVLERVHEVGLSGLTSRERKVLERASRRRRGAG